MKWARRGTRTVDAKSSRAQSRTFQTDIVGRRDRHHATRHRCHGRLRRPLPGILGDSVAAVTGPPGIPLHGVPVDAGDRSAKRGTAALRASARAGDLACAQRAILGARNRSGKAGVPGRKGGGEGDSARGQPVASILWRRAARATMVVADPGPPSNSWPALAGQPLLLAFLSSSFIILFRHSVPTPIRTACGRAMRGGRGTAAGIERDRRGRRGGPWWGSSGTMWGRPGTEMGNMGDLDSPHRAPCGEH